MSSPSHPPVDAASNLPEDAVVCGLPLHFIRQIAEAQSDFAYGEMTLYKKDGIFDRIKVEKSIKVEKPIKLQARIQVA